MCFFMYSNPSVFTDGLLDHPVLLIFDEFYRIQDITMILHPFLPVK